MRSVRSLIAVLASLLALGLLALAPAEVKVLTREGGSEAEIELSGPAGGAQGTWASAGGSKR